MPYLYAIHDSNPVLQKRGMFVVKASEAGMLNEQGFGIFISVNEFKNPIRKISNLAKVVAWAIDIDGAEKPVQLERLKRGLVPSLVIESKRSLHAYWRARDATFDDPEQTKAYWNAVQVDRIVPFYGADKNARDLARVLRMPGFKHMKDPNNPFLVEKIWEHDVQYSVKEMLWYYPDANAHRKNEKEKAKAKLATRNLVTNGNFFWEKAFSLNCEYALERLSGHAAVAGDNFSFKLNSSGTKNIWVNGKSSSSWIDVNGRIGSLSEGGPSIVQWLKWHGHNYSKIAEILKEVFPECL